MENDPDQHDFTPEELEFGKNAADSSKDNFLVWMVEKLELLRARFNWTDEELEAIAELLMEARDNAIDDLGAAFEGITGRKIQASKSGVPPETNP